MLISDSNVAIAISALALDLTRGTSPAFVLVDAAQAGAGIRHPTSDFWAKRLGDVLAVTAVDGFVINLGINDTGLEGGATSRGYACYEAKVDWLMSLLPSSKPVWWTNLPCDIEPEYRHRGCAEVNHALAGAPKRWPNLTILDWADTARGRREFLLPDAFQVHLSSSGGNAWAALISGAVKERFGTP
jgi:lysophospholipase L1-like esterase